MKANFIKMFGIILFVIVGMNNVYADVCYAGGKDVKVNGEIICIDAQLLEKKDSENDETTITNDFYIDVNEEYKYVRIYITEMVDTKISNTFKFNSADYEINVRGYNANEESSKGNLEIKSDIKQVIKEDCDGRVCYSSPTYEAITDSDYDFWKDYEFYVEEPLYVYPSYNENISQEEKNCDEICSKVQETNIQTKKDYSLKFMNNEYDLPMDIIIPIIGMTLLILIIVVIVVSIKSCKLKNQGNINKQSN